MIQLFLILIVGWVGHKTKVFPAETQTALTKLVDEGNIEDFHGDWLNPAVEAILK